MSEITERFPPIIIKGRSLIRKNKKEWNSIYNFFDTKELFKFTDNVIEYDSIESTNIGGVIFCTNGDIKINSSNTVKISLMQRLDWNISYEQFIDNVDYCIFAGEEFYKQFGLQSEKNLAFGNPMFDDVIDGDSVYKKFKLDSSKKYCLILLPNRIDTFHPDDFYFSHDDLLRIYSYLTKLNYIIITKSRPKTVKLYGKIDSKFLGDVHVVSSSYPNETLELLRISDLCLMFSSTAISESYRMKVPTIDLKIRPYQGNGFFLDDKTYVRIDDWIGIDYDRFSDIVHFMETKNSSYFDVKINKYFPKEKSSVRCVDFLEENYMKELICNGININDKQKIRMDILGIL